MNRSKVIAVTSEYIQFENDIQLFSDHIGDCCEHHELTLTDLTMADFEGLEFDLTDHRFFNKIPEYGIELIPIKGHSVKIPGHGHNNGYYSTDLTLVLKGNDFEKRFDIIECQVITD